MTGLDIEKDKLLEIAVIVTEGDTLTTVGKTESIIINCDTESLENMNEWCVKQHGKSGLTQACRDSKISCEEAEKMVLEMLSKHTVKGKSPLAGNTVSVASCTRSTSCPRARGEEEDDIHLQHRSINVVQDVRRPGGGPAGLPGAWPIWPSLPRKYSFMILAQAGKDRQVMVKGETLA